MTSWGARADQATYYPDMIALFETEANRRLRVRQMEATATVTMTSGVGTLPTDYLAWREVIWPGSLHRVLQYVSRSYMEAASPDGASGFPSHFTIDGSSIYVMPVDSTSLTMHYYQKIPAIASASTNWLLTANPDCYLWGSLAELFAKTRDLDKVQPCLARRDAAFDAITNLWIKTEVGAVRLMGMPTP